MSGVTDDLHHQAPPTPGGMSFAGYRVGQVVNAVSARLEERVTKPPKRYTQPTLVDDMVAAWKFGRSEAERQMLRETGGLGTSRTRVSMIEGLIQRGLLETVKVGKSWQLRCSARGRAILAMVPDEMRSVAMTARWELAFSGIRAGKFPAKAVLSNGYKIVDTMIDGLRSRKNSSPGAARLDSLPGVAAGAANSRSLQ